MGMQPACYSMQDGNSDAASVDRGEEERHRSNETILVEADPERGFNYPYYLALPDEIGTESRASSESSTCGAEFGSETRPILVEPHNVAHSDDDFEKHLELAKQRIENGYGRPIADELGSPYLIPVFPRPREDPVDWTHMIHMLCARTMQLDEGPLERVDRQLLCMVEDAQERLVDAGYLIPEEFMLNGFSSQAAFVNRFTALHPDRVCSVSAGGINGLVILPEDRIEIRGFGKQDMDYPVGIANVEELIGKPFDLNAFRNVDQFLYMGEDDNKDALLYPDAWTDPELRGIAVHTYGEDIHEERFPYCKSVYEEYNVNAVFKIYENTGHTAEPAVSDIVEFHRRSLDGEDIDSIRADLGGNVA